MDSEADPPKTLSTRHKCSACFKQYKKKEHLVEHMRASYHSIHQPKCGVCEKHCKTFESLREHITGPLSKANCSKFFADQGCSLCMNLFDSPTSVSKHLRICRLPAPSPLEIPCTGSDVDTSPDHNTDLIVVATDCEMGIPCTGSQIDASSPKDEDYTKGPEVVEIDSEVEMCCMGYTIGTSPPDNGGHKNGPKAIAIDCEMVGGGSDGSLDICARVCLIDEDENLIFHTYLEPRIPVTNYRYDVTGITKDHLDDAMPLKEVKEKILQILYNGESIGRARLDGGKARLLVGHDVEHDMDCLNMYYPDHLLRDTAKYRPLMKTNLVSHSLKYLTQTYLGYDIQSGLHDPFIDCVSAMRLYKRMRDQDHDDEGLGKSITPQHKPNWMTNSFDGWEPKELETMTPDELFQISRSNYRCWCLDRSDPSSNIFLEMETNVQSLQTPWPAWPIEGPIRIISF